MAMLKKELVHNGTVLHLTKPTKVRSTHGYTPENKNLFVAMNTQTLQKGDYLFRQEGYLNLEDGEVLPIRMKSTVAKHGTKFGYISTVVFFEIVGQEQLGVFATSWVDLRDRAIFAMEIQKDGFTYKVSKSEPVVGGGLAWYIPDNAIMHTTISDEGQADMMRIIWTDNPKHIETIEEAKNFEITIR
jgi:hypothetical protein